MVAIDAFVAAKPQNNGLPVQGVRKGIAQWLGNLVKPAGIATFGSIYSAVPGKYCFCHYDK
jgi:hypothetical protein